MPATAFWCRQRYHSATHLLELHRAFVLWLTQMVHFPGAEHDFWINIKLGWDREPTWKDASFGTEEPCFCPFSSHWLQAGTWGRDPTSHGAALGYGKFRQQQAAEKLIVPIIRKQGNLPELQWSGNSDMGSWLGRVCTNFRYPKKLLTFVVDV